MDGDRVGISLAHRSFRFLLKIRIGKRCLTYAQTAQNGLFYDCSDMPMTKNGLMAVSLLVIGVFCQFIANFSSSWCFSSIITSCEKSGIFGIRKHILYYSFVISYPNKGNWVRNVWCKRYITSSSIGCCAWSQYFGKQRSEFM